MFGKGFTQLSDLRQPRTRPHKLHDSFVPATLMDIPRNHVIVWCLVNMYILAVASQKNIVSSSFFEVVSVS